MWKEIISEVDSIIPPFNDYLLKQFRNLDNLIKEADEVFKESQILFMKHNLHYNGYKVLTPTERLQYHKTSRFDKNAEIKHSNKILVQYEFEYQGQTSYATLEMPYLENGVIVNNDVVKFPQIAIVEKGSRIINKNTVKIQAMWVIISFEKKINKYYYINTVEGVTFRDILISSTIHQKSKNTPVILYPLCKFGLQEVQRRLGFKETELTFTPFVQPSDDFYHIKLNDHLYMRCHKDSIKDLHKRRFLVSMYIMLTKSKIEKPYVNQLYDNNKYFIYLLGLYTAVRKLESSLLYNNARDHMLSCDIMLNKATIQDLSEIGIKVKNVYELAFEVFLNIDKWISDYDPSDLFQKKIGTLKKILDPYIDNVFTKQFALMKNKNKELKPADFKKFVNTISSRLSGYLQSAIFKNVSMIYNDNWLLSIGSKRYRSIAVIENKKKGDGDHKPALDTVLAHPSQMAVETISSLPPTNVVVTGTINPYLEIDKNGEILSKQHIKPLKHVYKGLKQKRKTKK